MYWYFSNMPQESRTPLPFQHVVCFSGSNIQRSLYLWCSMMQIADGLILTLSLLSAEVQTDSHEDETS